jgi:hypothetical protein
LTDYRELFLEDFLVPFCLWQLVNVIIFFLGEISVTSELSVTPDSLLSIQSTVDLVNQLYLVYFVIWHELCSWWRGLGFDFLFRKEDLDLEDGGFDVISSIYDGF